jgi:hypothetical protein
MIDQTFYLPLSWKDCYALRAVLREHMDDPRIAAIANRKPRQAAIFIDRVRGRRGKGNP